MAVTQNTYTGNGSTVLFSFTFPYLQTSDIKVSLNGVDTTAYTLANATTVQFNSAPANGTAVHIYRETDDASVYATFFPGSSIRSQDLNDSFTQILYKSQETADFAASTDASAIQATANSALANSNQAISTANAASTTANGIAATANTALTNSTTAITTANSAQTTADSAQTTANGISTTANNALSTASSAQTTANAAMPKTGGTFTGNIVVPSLNGGPLSGNRNRIINGDMSIDQRNSGASVSISANDSSYTVDRWECYNITDGSFSVQRSTEVPSSQEFSHSLLTTVTGTDTSLASNQYALIRQFIEGLNTKDLRWGTASAKSITISFWVRSSITGTFTVALQNSAQNRSYVTPLTVSSANTWEYKTFTVAGPTDGTWLINNGKGVAFSISLAAGTFWETTANTWASLGRLAVSGASNLLATNGATFYLTGVQIEPGTVATPFEYRLNESDLCQRYYQASTSTSIMGSLPESAATYRRATIPYRVAMRAAPTGTVVWNTGTSQTIITSPEQASAQTTIGGSSGVATISSYTLSIEL